MADPTPSQSRTVHLEYRFDRLFPDKLVQAYELLASDRCWSIAPSPQRASCQEVVNEQTDRNEPPPVAGVVFVGNYHSRSELPSVSFGNGSATIQDCGSLVPDSHDYTIQKSGNTVQLALANEPDPIVVTLQPDGTVSGPGSVLVKGHIITGYTTTTKTVMVDGAPAAAQGYYCNGPCSTSTSAPNYAPKIERCTIGSMSLVRSKPVERERALRNRWSWSRSSANLGVN